MIFFRRFSVNFSTKIIWKLWREREVQSTAITIAIQQHLLTGIRLYISIWIKCFLSESSAGWNPWWWCYTLHEELALHLCVPVLCMCSLQRQRIFRHSNDFVVLWEHLSFARIVPCIRRVRAIFRFYSASILILCVCNILRWRPFQVGMRWGRPFGWKHRYVHTMNERAHHTQDSFSVFYLAASFLFIFGVLSLPLLLLFFMVVSMYSIVPFDIFYTIFIHVPIAPLQQR